MLKGVDISNYQADDAVNQGVDFVICKATEGIGFVDHTCDPKYQMAKNQGKLLGVYHFARPEYGNGAIAEADFFVDNVQGYIGEAILVLDWETSTWQTDWAKQWLDRVYERTGVRPLIYMSASAVKDNDWSAIANDYGLWIAGYPNKYHVSNPPEPTEGEMPYYLGAWKFWAIWQYTSTLGALDRDIANMDRDAWLKYAGANTENPVLPAPVNPAPVPVVSHNIYIVQRGDTLSGIAAKFGTTFQKIAADNGISNPNLIYAGTPLKIYSSGSNTGGGASGQTYVVQSGDTLSGIAARFGTTVADLVVKNHIANPDLIYAGTTLTI